MEGGILCCCRLFSQELVDHFAHFFIGGGADDLVLDDALFVKDDGDRPGIGAAVALKEHIVFGVTAMDKSGIRGEVALNPFGDIDTVFFKGMNHDHIDLIAVILVQLGEFGL